MSYRILVVDDEEAVGLVLREYFRGLGHSVDVASELAEAKAMVAARGYDVVLSDLRLTGLHGAEGFELLSYLRVCHPQTRSIILTAYETPAVANEARERGASLVLSKPHPLPALARTIERLMGEPA